MTEGMVLAREGGKYRVLVEGEPAMAVLRGSARRGEAKAVAGDHVALEGPADGVWAIRRVEPRRNLLARRVPGGRGERPIAANLDRVFVMTATADPEPVLQLLDRHLVLAEANDIPAAVIVNKLDIDPGAALIARMERAGYEVFPVCVSRGTGLGELFQRMHTLVSVITGPSGVGKSSLLNALQPGLVLRTAEVSERNRRGRNTTVAATMIPLEGGGFLVDTPGFSDVGLWGLDPKEFAQCFPDLLPHAARCRFQDCAHKSEPGCAVREAVGREIQEDRYASYLALLEELENLPEDWE